MHERLDFCSHKLNSFQINIYYNCVKMNDQTQINCRCDPLKIIVRDVFIDSVKQFDLYVEARNRVHMFYKSSLFGHVANCMNLRIKLLHETFDLLKEWVEDITVPSEIAENKESQASSKTDEEKLVLYDVCRSPPDECGNIELALNTSQITAAVVQQLNVGRSPNCRTSVCHPSFYKVEIGTNGAVNGNSGNPLLKFRKTLVINAISTAMRKAGHFVNNGQFTSLPKISHNTILVIGIPFHSSTTTTTDKPIMNDPVMLELGIGGVLPASRNGTLNQLICDRVNGINQMMKSKDAGSSAVTWTNYIENLTLATIYFDILKKPLDSDVTLSPSIFNNDGLFVMYNYSRVLSILRCYEDRVQAGKYPPLPHISEVIFDSIPDCSEELLLLRLILEWPLISENIINFVKFECNVNHVPRFLIILANAFNNFYNEIMVLVPDSAVHKFHLMQARVYLIKAIRNIFQECLEIIHVDHSSLNGLISSDT